MISMILQQNYCIGGYKYNSIYGNNLCVDGKEAKKQI